MEDVISQTLSITDNSLCPRITCVNVVCFLLGNYPALFPYCTNGSVWTEQPADRSRLCGSVIHTYWIRMGLYRSPFVGWSSDFFSPRIPRV